MQGTVIVIVTVYLLVMLSVGYLAFRRMKSSTDFMLFGRRMGPLLIGASLAATEIGIGATLGVVENASNLGASRWGLSAVWYILTMGIAFMVISLFAPKLRKAGVKTVPEYFRRRYGDFAGVFTSITMLLPMIGFTAGQFMATAAVFSILFGTSWAISLLIAGSVITACSVMGGMRGVAVTNFIQIILIVLGIFLTLPFAVNFAGGWSQIRANVSLESLDLFKGIGGPQAIIALSVMYLASFTVGQEVVSRYYSASDGKAARRGSMIAALINGIYAFIPAVLGIIILAIVKTGQIDKDFILMQGSLYSLPVLAVFTMPAFVVGLLFVGIISATMSSAESDLLAAGSIFSHDIWKRYIRKEAREHEMLLVTRSAMIVVGIFSVLIALEAASIMDLLVFSFTLRAAGAFFPYVLGHYWKKASTAGAVASLLVGSLVSIVFERHLIPDLTFFGWERQPVIPGLVFACTAFVGFSLLFPPRRETTEFLAHYPKRTFSEDSDF
ncbi:MAG: sodium:solute symporter family protein [Spirochaetaceae bacterium]|jgi:SSS family solute:Na+ symporter|nr:sodium:solute symporter family protein [Spirochaetaceae bacterium]